MLKVVGSLIPLRARRKGPPALLEGYPLSFSVREGAMDDADLDLLRALLRRQRVLALAVVVEGQPVAP